MPSVEVTAAATPILGRLATRTINEVRDQSPDLRRHAEAAEDYRVGNHSYSSQDATTWIVRRPASPVFCGRGGLRRASIATSSAGFTVNVTMRGDMVVSHVASSRASTRPGATPAKPSLNPPLLRSACPDVHLDGLGNLEREHALGEL